jgi:hypothetical protein
VSKAGGVKTSRTEEEEADDKKLESTCLIMGQVNRVGLLNDLDLDGWEWLTLDRTCVHALAVDCTCGPSGARSFTITGDSPNEEELECLIAVDDSDAAMRTALLSAVVEEQSRRWRRRWSCHLRIELHRIFMDMEEL